MTCDQCGNKEAYQIRSTYSVKDGLVSSCNRCDNFIPSTIPDVYWPGHEHENKNLTDKNGVPIPLRSRAHKAQVMKELGVMETGDRVRGSNLMPEASGPSREDRRREFNERDRPMIQRLLRGRR